MKKITLFFALLFSYSVFAQFTISDGVNSGKQIDKDSKSTNYALEKKWIQTAELELILPSETKYSYSQSVANGSVGYGEILDNKLSFGALYTINYPLFKKFTLGALGGFQYQNQQNISALKLGGMFRYYFKDYENANMYLLTAKNISVNDKINSAMANVRLGLQFPVKKTSEYNLTLNVFWDYNYYDVKKTLLDLDENPGYLNTRGYGVSFGIQF